MTMPPQNDGMPPQSRVPAHVSPNGRLLARDLRGSRTREAVAKALVALEE